MQQDDDLGFAHHKLNRQVLANPKKFEYDRVKAGKDKKTLRKLIPKKAKSDERAFEKELNLAVADLTEISHYQF